ncbi:MAG: zinc dependent phospholipase C family protein [Pseudobutyrivibrio sp.]|nr:zinc dependent phospholipase C family protein [Pseudobutyrivibrio sp.]
MPGFITHLEFGRQSLSFIDDKETKKLLEEYSRCFYLGLEGPDIFFYHLPAYFKKGRNIGNIMHDTNVMLFFENLFDARNTFESTTDRKVCDAYIIGFMGHYTLDVSCHPYIYYKSDHFNNLKRSSKYDFGKHVSLETDIDHIVLDHYEHLKPTEFNYGGTISPTKEQKIVIAQLLCEAINNTFEDANISFKMIFKAINSIINLNYKMRDPDGKKKRLVRGIEQVLFKHCWISAMIPSDTIIKYNDPCNIYHNTWHNPWYPSIPRTDSIFDLINKSMPNFIDRITIYIKSCDSTAFIEDDLNSIDETNRYLHYRNNLLSNLSDLSYLSGLPL